MEQLLADKYRYLGRQDYPATDADVVVEDIAALADFVESGEEYRQALQGGGVYRQPLWHTPDSTEIGYERGVKERLAELARKFPNEPLITLLGRAL